MTLFQPCSGGQNQYMKTCPECRSALNVESPYCDACGFQFTWERPRSLYRKESLRGTALAAGLAAAVLQYVLRG